MRKTSDAAPNIFEPPTENRLYPRLFAIHREIHRFSQDLDNFKWLLEIQRQLIDAISEAEEAIRGAKKVNEDPRGWQYVRYNYLCLGDCLAFLYADRFALKQTFFDVDTVNPKQSGGFITGKAGAVEEIAHLEYAISRGVPTILCDITNVLRYGDICLLGGSDPVPIEIKSSKAKDGRSKRQKQKLKALSSFLALDRSDDFRGIPGTTFRTEYSVPLKSYSDQLQAAILQASELGSTSFQVDGCLKVIVIMENMPDYDVLFGGFGSSRVLVNNVNQIKTNQIWGCFYPYPLTLSESEHYEGFVKGEINIVTLFDMEAFEDNLALEGTRLSVEANEHDIQCQIHFSDLLADDEGVYYVIGEYMMCRIWTDFLCPSWIVQNSVSSVVKVAEASMRATDT